MSGLAELGFGGGQIIGQQADDAARKAQMDRLESLSKIEKTPYEIQNMVAQARYHEAQAQAKEAEVAAQERMAAMAAQRLGSGAAASIMEASDPVAATVGYLADLAEIQTAGGKFNEARQSMEGIPTAILRGERTLQAQEATQQTKLQSQKLKGEIAGLWLNAVKADDPASIAAAEAGYKKATGESLFDGQEVTPQRLDFMRRGAISVRQQAELDLRKVDDERQARRLKLEEKVAESTAKTNEVRRRLGEARITAIGKTEGKQPTFKAPTDRLREEARSAAATMITEAFPDLKEKSREADLSAASFETVTAAIDLMHKNPGIRDMGMALRRVLDEKIKNGDFAEGDVPGKWFGTNKGTRYSPGMGKSPLAPLALPKDLNAVEVGKHYNTKYGVVKYLGGGKFSDPIAPPKTGGVAGRPDAAPIDLDDDEED